MYNSIWIVIVVRMMQTAKVPPLAEIVDGKFANLNFHEGQYWAWYSKARIILALGGSQSGKALALDTPIPTPGGFKSMGDIKIGDRVLDRLGKSCNVWGVSPIYYNHACFKVSFSNGDSVVADQDHLWGLLDDRYARAVSGIDCYRVLNTSDLHGCTANRFELPMHQNPAGVRAKSIHVSDVSYCGSMPVKCIVVDSWDHLYLCGRSMVPTHNSEFGPYWLAREIGERGPGDYLIAGPNFPLLSKKVMPAFLKLFKRQLKWGKLTGGRSQHFELNGYAQKCLWGKVQDEDTKIFFGHAVQPDSLESATAKAVWLDEAGQKGFKIGAWEAVNRRVAINKGRILITTTPYNVSGWLRDVYDRAKSGDPDYFVSEFESIANPAFPREEYERAKRELPGWKFDLFYRGRFTKPPGAIYDCFDKGLHTCPDFAIPDDWSRYVGLDFGGVNTAAVFLAAEKRWDDDLDDWGEETGRYFLYREYHCGGKTASSHAKAIYVGEPKMPRCVGGSSSEGQWRKEFAAGGLNVMDPCIGDPKEAGIGGNEGKVEVGINRVYSLIKEDNLMIFQSCKEVIEDIENYSRELDDSGNPTEKIEEKEIYHVGDALRYACYYLKRKKRLAMIS